MPVTTRAQRRAAAGGNVGNPAPPATAPANTAAPAPAPRKSMKITLRPPNPENNQATAPTTARAKPAAKGPGGRRIVKKKAPAAKKTAAAADKPEPTTANGGNKKAKKGKKKKQYFSESSGEESADDKTIVNQKANVPLNKKVNLNLLNARELKEREEMLQGKLKLYNDFYPHWKEEEEKKEAGKVERAKYELVSLDEVSESELPDELKKKVGIIDSDDTSTESSSSSPSDSSEAESEQTVASEAGNKVNDKSFILDHLRSKRTPDTAGQNNNFVKLGDGAEVTLDDEGEQGQANSQDGDESGSEEEEEFLVFFVEEESESEEE